ncbi:MAG: hypothetical protein DRP50_03340 [Thermotoga sp.]|mgnify:CR=1 FL=1|nr:MAG: hypothetical protein DRP50_03340 [Thermotoga sp.]
MGKKTFWFGITLIGIGILVVAVSSTFPGFVVGGKKLPGPGFFPTILSIILMIGGIYEILISLRTKGVKKYRRSFVEYCKDWGNQNIFIVILSLILYVPIIKWIGFIVGTFLLSLLLTIRLKATWLRGIITSVILVIIIILIFEKIFKISLPEGIFGINF